MQTSHKKFNKPLFLLVILFVLPVVAGWFLYHYHEYFQFKTLNHGSLVNPPIPTQQLGLYDEKQTKWQIVYMPKGCCDAQCEKMTFTLHQLRIALNKESKRVNLTLVLSTTCPAKQTHDFQKIDFTEQQYIQFKNAFSSIDNHFSVRDKIYLIDPMGNLFMQYSTLSNPMDILKDLKRVLEVSQIG